MFNVVLVHILLWTWTFYIFLIIYMSTKLLILSLFSVIIIWVEFNTVNFVTLNCIMLHHTIYHYIWPTLRHAIQGLCQLSFAFRKNYWPQTITVISEDPLNLWPSKTLKHSRDIAMAGTSSRHLRVMSIKLSFRKNYWP